MMERENLKGDLVKQQNLVRVADNSLGFGFDCAVRKNKAGRVKPWGWSF